MEVNILIGFVVIALCTAAIIVVLREYRESQRMKRLNEMLEAAIAGTYEEQQYDESVISSIEAKMAHFLSNSNLSYKQVAKERDRIQTLISDISHQTKTPVSNLMLYSELLAEMELSIQAQNAVQEITRQAEKLHFLISALVKLSRLENGIIEVNPKVQSVKKLLDVACEEILPKANEKMIEIKMEISDMEAVYDLKWTAEALYNLLDNAIKYSDAGGNIRVSACAFELFCRIAVEDRGIGIDEEEYAKIFSRFYRSPITAQEEGVGVGLCLARQIVSAQGGYIRVRSKKGQGSVFSLYIPRNIPKK